MRKILCAIAIAAVAITAGVISYTHIYDLSVALHQAALVAYLMPIGIDGLVVVGSVVLLSDGGALGWLGIGPGVVISIFANMESGLRFGWLSATWAGIPALSFFLATFILERWIKNGRHSSAEPETVPEVNLAGDPETVTDAPGSVPAAVPVPVTVSAPQSAPRTRPQTAPGRPRKAAPEVLYASDLASGQVPSQRRIRSDLGVGQPKAKSIQEELAAALSGTQAA
jgi:hypothetical protein